MKLKSGLYETDGYSCLGNLNNDSVDLRLIYCGYEDCAPGHRFGPNKRTAYVLHVVTKGCGRLEVGGINYSLHEGDAFVLRPEEEAWYEADHLDPWTYIWVGFQGLKAEECVVNSGFTNGNHVIHNVDYSNLQGYVSSMLKAYKLRYSNALRRCAFLQMFFADLIDCNTSNIPGIEEVDSDPGSEYIKYLMSFLAENYGQRIRINEIADRLGMNRSYLSSSFKNATGMSPTEYLINIRMEKAKSLLTNTNYSISRIAAEVGYPDQLAFSRMFRLRFGESPKNYREDIEKIEIKAERTEPAEALL